MDPDMAEFTVTSMPHWVTIANYLYLGRTEFVRFARAPFQLDRLRTISSRAAVKLSFLFTSDDFWGPSHLHERIRAKNFAGVETALIPGIPHAFGVKISTSKLVADWLVNQLKPDKKRQ